MPVKLGNVGAALLSVILFYGMSTDSIADSITPSNSTSDLPIFPGAEGFGVTTVGGRHGILCRVSVLDESGPGSLRSCIDKDEPRIVVFETGGTITVSEPLVIKNPYISIFGQTAPGSGILIRSTIDSKKSPMEIQTHDVLVQHMRLRAGSSNQSTCCRDALRISNSEPGQVYNVVIDHNSLSWGTDQIANTWYDTNNVTFSFNLIAESLHDNGSNDKGPAGRGLLIGSEGAHSISLHHNLIAHSYQRNPMLRTSGIVDVVNNFVYHWVTRAGEQRSDYVGQKVNWVKNRFVARTDWWFSRKKQLSRVSWGDIKLSESNHSLKDSVYFEDNIGHHRKHGLQAQWKIAFTDKNTPYKKELGYHTEERFPAPPITEVSVNKLRSYLLPRVGATLPVRDEVDVRIIRDVLESSGLMPNCVGVDDLGDDPRCLLNVGGWPHMETGDPRQDSDADGMPDEWEKQNGLDPLKFDSLEDQDADGYLNIENWVHSLSADGND